MNDESISPTCYEKWNVSDIDTAFHSIRKVLFENSEQNSERPILVDAMISIRAFKFWKKRASCTSGSSSPSSSFTIRIGFLIFPFSFHLNFHWERECGKKWKLCFKPYKSNHFWFCVNWRKKENNLIEHIWSNTFGRKQVINIKMVYFVDERLAELASDHGWKGRKLPGRSLDLILLVPFGSKILNNNVRWLFSSLFWPLLKQASIIFEAAEEVAKIGSSLKPNPHKHA